MHYLQVMYYLSTRGSSIVCSAADTFKSTRNLLGALESYFCMWPWLARTDAKTSTSSAEITDRVWSCLVLDRIPTSLEENPCTSTFFDAAHKSYKRYANLHLTKFESPKISMLLETGMFICIEDSKWFNIDQRNITPTLANELFSPTSAGKWMRKR